MVHQLSRRAVLVGAGALAAAASSMGSWRAAAAPTPSLVNGGFEEPVVDGVIPGWRVAYGDASAVSVVTSPVHGGEHALRLVDTSTSASVGVLSEPVAIEGDGTVRVTAWSQSADPAAAPLIYLRFYGAGGNQVGQVVEQATVEPGSWARTTFLATPPSGTASVRLILYSPSSRTSDVYWDDIAVSEIVYGRPLVTNGDFEATVADHTIPGWSLAQGSASDVAVVTGTVHQGQQSLNLSVRPGHDPVVLVNDRFDVVPGMNIGVEAWVFATDARPAHIAVRFTDSDGEVVAVVQREASPQPNEWSHVTMVAMAPDGAQYGQVVLSSPDTRTSQTWWDDVAASALSWREERLGTPITSVTMTRAAFGIHNGRDVVFATSAGKPGLFQVIDVRTGEVIDAQPLGNESGSWSVAQGPDGSVYVGTYSTGQLYRWQPASGTFTSLGRPTANTAYVWDLEFDDAGILWGSSYPRAEVFSFDPASQQFQSHGSMADDEEYAHTLALADGKVYVGLGTNRARIAVLDPTSGEVSIIELPEAAQGSGFVFDLDARGDYLLVRTRVDDQSQLMSFHRPTATWQTIEPIGVFALSATDAEGRAHYVALDGTLKAFDSSTGTVSATGFTGLAASRGLGWVQLDDTPAGLRLATIDDLGRIGLYDPATDTGEIRPTQAEGTPAQLQALAVGPDRKLYLGGYQFSGLSRYDPTSDTTEQFDGGVLQVEGLHTHGSELYIGDYGGAGVYRYDPTRPWSPGANPRQFAKLADAGQDRPFAWTSAGDKVAFGTVPAYGLLGGVLGVYDPAADELAVHADVVPDQSIVALAATPTIIYGGTSVNGGGGSTPTQQVGKVFAWDVRTGTKLWEVAPLANARAVTALALAPNGNLWGSTVGTVFEMDPDGTVLRTAEFAPFGWTATRWVSDHVSFGADGYLYVITTPVSKATLWQVDPVTLTKIKIATGITYWSLAHLDGTIYFKRLSELCRLTLR